MNFKLFFATLFLVALSPVTLLARSNPDSLKLNYDSLLYKVRAAQPDYETMATRSKFVWDDGNSEQDFQANIRMLRDSIVWMSLTGSMGLEGFRLFITRDSLRMLNKMSNEYDVHDFGYISSWLMFPVNFKMLQQMIAGQKIDIFEKATMAVYEDSLYVIYAENDKMREKIWVNTQNYTISKIVLKDKLLTQEMTVTFDGYKELPEGGGKRFSYQRIIDVNRDGMTLKLTIDFTRIRLNDELTYPFEVSGKYKR